MTRNPLRHVASLIIAWPLLISASSAWAQSAPIDARAADERPLADERFKRFAAAAVGPSVLVQTIGWAAIAQARDEPVEWGQDAKGYGKRFASLVAQGVVQESVTYGLSEALKVDSTFHKSQKHGFLPRAGDAMMQAVLSRRQNGHRVLSAPLLAGYTAGGMAMLSWYPAGYDYKDGFRYSGLALGLRGAMNLVREFTPLR